MAGRLITLAVSIAILASPLAYAEPLEFVDELNDLVVPRNIEARQSINGCGDLVSKREEDSAANETSDGGTHELLKPSQPNDPNSPITVFRYQGVCSTDNTSAWYQQCVARDLCGAVIHTPCLPFAQCTRHTNPCTWFLENNIAFCT
ncbi:hypothetical protein Tdes44962_MAKER04820 [Teratosphaeria destructans]|uniref:Uncharacterized protein n=1 Tax=Teratosphaeria destructans TaxID=418781 RepID=A0A9W7VZV3_9PEZI|nr:hypothetical protein Tdes44962_MAKER04820 [Teratosphaeria destructans]